MSLNNFRERRYTHSLHICKFFLMYTAVQLNEGIDALAEAPFHLPALAAVLYMAH